MRLLLCLTSVLFADVDVSTSAQLREAAARARPGTTIRLAPGRYQGGVYLKNLRGEPGAPIVIQGADRTRPSVFEGGSYAIMMSKVAHVELRDLGVLKPTDNGINIDDGGDLENPSHHVVLHGLTIRDVGPDGNRDGIKLSGVADFRVEGCFIERWGSGGSGIDMVGCRDGLILSSTFRHGDDAGGNGVQMKGGTRDVTIRNCRFDHAGQRAINIGGSTGMAFFRPRPEGFEAKDIIVEDCVIIGSPAAVAFVGVDGAVVRRNTIVEPRNWIIRILQETTGPEFVPSRRGEMRENLIVFRAGGLREAVNVGPGTAPGTFSFTGNAWYASDAPGRSRPKIPLPEQGGVYGVEPHFLDAANGDYRLDPAFPDPRGKG